MSSNPILLAYLKSQNYVILGGFATSDAFEPDEGDVNRAILASTATTVAVFLPLGMIGGIVGQAFLPFALTVTFALAASYFVVSTVYSLVDQFGRQFSARFRRRATAPVTSD